MLPARPSRPVPRRSSAMTPAESAAANAMHAVAAAAASASSASPAASSPSASSPSLGQQQQRGSGISKPCCVVGCTQKREKEGYCMAHFIVFKQNVDPAAESARQKEVQKQLKLMEAERERIRKADAAERQKRSSAILAASAKTLPAMHGGSHAHGHSSLGTGPPAKSWWRRNSLGSVGCFSTDAVDEPAEREIMPHTEAPLLLEVRASWATAHKVVFKDLPRLAKRTTVATAEFGTLIDSGRIVRIPLRKPTLIPTESAADESAAAAAATAAVASPASASAGPARAARVTRVGVGSSDWHSWAGCENESWTGKEAMRVKNRAVDAAAAAAAPASASAIPAAAAPHEYIDTHLSDPHAEIETWQAVCNVLLCVLEQLEPTEVVFAARQALAVATSTMSVGSDHQSVLENIFTTIISLQSRTFKIFKAIHQSILFPAIAHLHEKLYSNPAIGNLKDCRRQDGWTVLIHLGPAIYITHQRWEQSLHPEHDPRHFELQWEMRISFDRQMEQLRAVILRVGELAFHPDASEEYKRSIRDVLIGSGYIV